MAKKNGVAHPQPALTNYLYEGSLRLPEMSLMA
jgi:hypothetical protein